MPRPIYVIAAEIRKTWPKVYFGAVPYLDAMFWLGDITDTYGYDSADSIVRYFLSNASTWRGEDARRIKAELKGMLKLNIELSGDSDYYQYLVDGKRRFVVDQSLSNRWHTSLVRKTEVVYLGSFDCFTDADAFIRNIAPHVKA